MGYGQIDMSSDWVMSYSSALYNLTMLERVRAALPTFFRPHKMGGHPHAHGLDVLLEMQKRLLAFYSQSLCQQSARQKCWKAQSWSVKK